MPMTADQFRRHGGRLAAARAAFPNAPEPWLDLSTGINPEPWPASRSPSEALRRLPDPADLTALEIVAARSFGTTPDRVAATAGADAALRLLPLLTRAASVAIASPTYRGHAQAWTAAGAVVSEVPIARIAEATAEAVVVVNPNNPDGAVHDPIALADPRRWLIIDESFVETRPELSVARHGLRRAIALRSFGKFWGLPGVRLGFLVAEPEIAQRARGLLGDWPVGGEAIAIGREAYADAAWAETTRVALAAGADRLDALLSLHDFEIVGGTSLFRLVRAGDSRSRFETLARQGVLTRPFDHDPALLRFGLPAADQWDRLAAALAQT